MVIWKDQMNKWLKLLDAGFVILATNCRNQVSWGNQQSLDDVVCMINMWKRYLNIEDEFYLLPGSMGGSVALNCINHNLFKVRAVAGSFPAINLDWCYIIQDLKV